MEIKDKSVRLGFSVIDVVPAPIHLHVNTEPLAAHCKSATSYCCLRQNSDFL